MLCMSPSGWALVPVKPVNLVFHIDLIVFFIITIPPGTVPVFSHSKGNLARLGGEGSDRNQLVSLTPTLVVSTNLLS